MKKVLSLTLLAAVLVFVTGCAKPPEAEMTAASASFQAAKSAEAEAYAPQAYRTASDTLNAANAAKQEADGKFALFRSYKKAKSLYVSAKALAEKAATDAQAEKERMRVEVSGLLEQARAQIAAADSALAKAPVGKGNKADIELIKNDLAAAKMALADVEKTFSDGKYLAAKPKAQSVISKAQSIQQEIANAAAKKSAKKK